MAESLESLIELARSGDVAARNQALTHPTVTACVDYQACRYAYAFPPDDMRQELYLRLCRELLSFAADKGTTAATWFRRKVRFLAVDVIRDVCGLRREQHPRPESLSELCDPPCYDVEPDWLTEQTATLSPGLQTVLTMRRAGHSFREIGDAMGVSESRVYQLWRDHLLPVLQSRASRSA